MSNQYEDRHFVPDIQEILQYWPQYDTAEIARILRVEESRIYNAIARHKGRTEPGHYQKIFDHSPMVTAK